MVDSAGQRARHDPRTEYYLAVAADDDEPVGFVRLAFAGVTAAKLGYAIRADRSGKQSEGRIRDHVFTNGAWRDSLLHSILEREWAARL